MKMKVSRELMEQTNGGNAHRKYAIRGFKPHLPSAVSVEVAAAVYSVLFFVLPMC